MPCLGGGASREDKPNKKFSLLEQSLPIFSDSSPPVILNLQIRLTGETNMRSAATALLLLLFVLVVPLMDGCDPGKTGYGCRIHQGQCTCGIGCLSEFRYPNRDECRKALKGKRYDICQGSPCYNNGACTQTSTHPWYRCRCEGTGFYGPKCQYACPSTSSSSLKTYPYECIVI